MRGLKRSAVLAGAVAVMLSSGMGIADASPPRPALGAPAWSITPTPRPPINATLDGVSCTSAWACTAIGWQNNSAGDQLTLAERWNGKAWAIQPTPSINGGPLAVSCTSASACTAVGEKVTTAGIGVTLAERWNGMAWTVQATPNPGGADGSALDGVSCTSASACTAVGEYNVTGNTVMLAERWNGTAWTVQATPNPALGSTGLGGVSCTSASACIAVGSYFSGSEGPGGPVAERWNGTAWTSQTIPNPPGNNGDGDPEGWASAVSCTSASACAAVGAYYNNATTLVTLAEHWNGKAWAIQHTPNPGNGSSGGTELDDVSCTSASACIAVGSGATGTLAERYGPSW